MRVGFSVVSPTAVKPFAMARRLACVAVCFIALPATGPRTAAAQPNEPDPTAVMSASLPVDPSPWVVVPMVTSALLPGHWQLEGAQYVWVPPDNQPRRLNVGR